MKTRSSPIRLLTTAALTTSLLLQCGCAHFEKFVTDPIAALGDRPIIPSAVVGAGAFFGAKEVLHANDGQAFLIATVATIGTGIVIKIATTAAEERDKREAQRRGRAILEARRNTPPAPTQSPGPAPSTTSTNRYIAIELPPAPTPSAPAPGTPVVVVPESTPAPTSTSAPNPDASSPTPTPASTATPTDGPTEPPTRFMIFDLETGEVVGNEVYESASRPRNEERIVVGQKELIYARSSTGGANASPDPAAVPPGNPAGTAP